MRCTPPGNTSTIQTTSGLRSKCGTRSCTTYYLTTTADLPSVIRAAPGTQYEMWVDSSLGNAFGEVLLERVMRGLPRNRGASRLLLCATERGRVVGSRRAPPDGARGKVDPLFHFWKLER
jgi:hypothetical protein